MAADDDDEIETRVGAAPVDEPAPRRAPVATGQRIGRYLALERLGAGGMGEVWLAYDPQLDRRVALKLLRRDRGGESDAQDRLLREAQALAKLSHPNVVAVHDVGTIEDLEAGIERTVYVAMEYIEGPTLREWTSAARSWKEIVATFRAAGAGLAAAHRVGIVHRDFKPTNVIVGEDGRVRVLDFGLARRLGRPLLSEAGSDDGLERSGDDLAGDALLRSSLDVHLTETGLVLGTPAYMAPEQFAGEEVDGRGDQFSFCVALWEALHGERPFAGRDAGQISRAVRRGKIQEPSRSRGEPGRVRAALRRGLQARPEARHPDMAALLAELDRALHPVRRGTLLLGAAAILSTAAITWSGREPPARPDPCAGATDRLALTWSGPRAAAITDAFARTTASYATDAAVTTGAAIDAWAASWIEARTEACVATRVRGDQSEELMDLRIDCLEARRGELEALLRVFEDADTDVVRNAVSGAMSLPPVAHCSDTGYLRAAIRPPDDPELAATATALKGELADARALQLAGKYPEATAAADAVLVRARPLGYDPVIAEAAIAAGQASERKGEHDRARAYYDEAIVAAARCGHVRVEAESLASLVNVLGYHKAQPEDARRYARYAEAVGTRLNDRTELTAAIAVHEANTHMRAGEYGAAAAKYTEVLGLRSEDPSIMRQQQAAALNLGAALGAQGKYRESRDALVAATERLRSSLGAKHPSFGTALMNLGATEWRLGDLESAGEHLAEAERVLVAALGANSVDIGHVQHNIAVVAAAQGDHEQALSHYRRALEIKRAALGPDHPSVALTSNNVGSSLHELGRDDEAERVLLDTLAIYERSVGRTHPDVSYTLSTLGLVHLARGDVEGAITLFEEAITLRTGYADADDNTTEARMGLARALHQAGREPQRALALAREVTRRFASDPAVSPDERAEAAALVAELGG